MAYPPPRYTVPGLFGVPVSPPQAGFFAPPPIPVLSFQLALAADTLVFQLRLSGTPSTFPPPSGEWSYGGATMSQFPNTVLQQCQLGDSGVELAVQVEDQYGNVVNIAAGTSLTIKIGKPDGSTTDAAASLYTNGADGIMSYVATANDLNQAGFYTVQGKLYLNGSAKSTAVGLFQVLGNVDNN